VLDGADEHLTLEHRDEISLFLGGQMTKYNAAQPIKQILLSKESTQREDGIVFLC